MSFSARHLASCRGTESSAFLSLPSFVGDDLEYAHLPERGGKTALVRDYPVDQLKLFVERAYR